MFDEGRIQARLDRLQRGGHLSKVGGGTFETYSVDDCRRFTAQLLPVCTDDGTFTRPLTRDEARFIAVDGARAAVDVRYFLERYVWIRRDGSRLGPLFPLWASQEHLLNTCARLERERRETKHPDGVLVDVLKARQLGVSTLTQAIIAHRAIFYGYTMGLIAANVPMQSTYLYSLCNLTIDYVPPWLRPTVLAHPANGPLRLNNGSAVQVESGLTMTGTEMEESQGRRGQLGTGRTYGAVHLSEIALWPYPEMMDVSLLPAIPRTPLTFCVRESTAQGRNNYWHQQWQLATKSRTRFTPLFIPWFIERSKYWLPPPANWSPRPETLAYVRRAEQHAPRWLFGQSVHLTKEQIYWYETERSAAEARDAYEPGSLAYFLANYPADPEESFQHTGRSIFGPLLLERHKSTSRQHRPEGIHTILDVQPKADLADLADLAALPRHP